MGDLALRNNTEQQRYEALIGEEVVGVLDYRPLSDGVIQLPHTKVGRQWEGRGVGSALVRFALDDLAAQNQRVDPVCPFIEAWVKRHPDYAPMVE